MGSFSIWHWLIVLVIVLLIFGPKRLPGLGKSLGHGFREFKDGITGKSTPDEEEQERPELTAASATPPAATNDRDAAEVASQERRS